MQYFQPTIEPPLLLLISTSPINYEDVFYCRELLYIMLVLNEKLYSWAGQDLVIRNPRHCLTSHRHRRSVTQVGTALLLHALETRRAA